MRWLALLFALSLAACGGPRYTRLDAPDATHPPHDPKAPILWLVFVDGLQSAALTAYLERLRAADWEPRWPSGIAQLKRSEKRLVRLRGAMSAAETGRGALATWLSGRDAAIHGQPGSRWLGAADAALRHGHAITAVNEPLDVHRYFTQAHPSGTLFDNLGAVRTAQVFLPYAVDPKGIVAVPAGGDAISAWIDGPNAEYSGPLVDAAAREAAVHILHASETPNLLGIGFRGAFWADDQVDALQRIDGELAEMVDALRRRHPEALPRLEVMIVGPSPTTALGPYPHRVHPDAVTQRLAALAPGCAQALRQSRMVANGRTLHLRVPRTRVAVDCLDRALRGAELYQSAWLDGAVWRRSTDHRVLLMQRTQDALGAERVRRVLARLPSSLGAADDAILFAGAATTFGTQTDRAVGGISPSALDAAWLWISGAMEEQAIQALEATPTRAADLAPTVLGAFDRSNPARVPPMRPPLVLGVDGRWRFNPASRLTSPSVTPVGAEPEDAPPFKRPPSGALAFACTRDASGAAQPRMTIPRAALMTVGANAVYWDSRLLYPGQVPAAVLSPFVVPADARATVTVDLSAMPALLAAVRRAFRIGIRRSRRELRARFGATPATRAPSEAFLALQGCDGLDRCYTRPLISDRDFQALLRDCR